ncbi:hypothetical protein O3P69_014324 [Scylla paramamosain]|uniref:Uncharacterized protein n=1 Tax=Scylla paramamosain TaxID=85552 RepID=A0AAW0TBL3_SCYPA
MDGKLRLHQHVSETRNRIHSWLRVMRSITATEGGADLRVMKTFYLQAIRTVIDNAAPLLGTIHPAQIEHLEKLQNKALWIMLGAPRWTKSLAHNEELFRKETWDSKTAQGIKSIQAEGSFLVKTLDVPHPIYTHAPPWTESSLHFSITPLTDKKDNLTTTDLARQAQRALAAGNTVGADIYFTDGSVDQATNRAAAAFVHEEKIGHYRLPDHSSTLQNELVAIRKALKHAKTRRKHEVRRLAAEGSPSATWYCAATIDAKDTLMTTPRLVMTRLHMVRLGYHCLVELNDTLPITYVTRHPSLPPAAAPADGNFANLSAAAVSMRAPAYGNSANPTVATVAMRAPAFCS